MTTFIYVLYTNDSLWDGQQCGLLEQPCCIYSKMPWFTKALNETTLQDIELRMMANERTYDEDTSVCVIKISSTKYTQPITKLKVSIQAVYKSFFIV